MSMSGWIGVDLDGTLAHYSGFIGPSDIGPPIKPMVKRVKQWLAEGVDVRVFTARVAAGQEFIPPIEQWCEEHIGQKLPVTNVKDFSMLELWDDRAVRVRFNQGVPCCSHVEKYR